MRVEALQWLVESAVEAAGDAPPADALATLTSQHEALKAKIGEILAEYDDGSDEEEEDAGVETKGEAAEDEGDDEELD